MNKRRKLLSVLLSLALILSLIPALSIPARADYEDSKLYFDTNGTGWSLGSKDKVAFYIFGDNLENGLDWGAKKAVGSAFSGQAGVFEFDPAAKGLTLSSNTQYLIIFVLTNGNNWISGEQTYELYFTTDCFGHVASCDGTKYVDNNGKTLLVATWEDVNSTDVGPVCMVNSNGDVVGSCLEKGKTSESVFDDFLKYSNNSGNTTYEDACINVVQSQKKTEQKMIDDIGSSLGLTKDQVKALFASNNITTTGWSFDVSTLPAAHTHDFTYSVSGDFKTIIATCANTDGNCPLENNTATLTLKPPANLVYDGKAKAATVEGEIPGVDMPEISYSKFPAEPVTEENVKDKGEYNASIALFGVKTADGENNAVTASVDFTITDPTYTITIPAKLTVENAGWNATAGVTASGEIAEGTKLTVTASSDGEFALVNQSDNTQKVGYKLAESGDSTTTYAGATEKTAWEFTAEELAAENGTTKAMGAVVEEYINKPAGEYADTVTFTAEVKSEGPKIYTSLTSGDVLHVGDMLDDPNTNYVFNGWAFNKSFTNTVVKANIETVVRPLLRKPRTANIMSIEQ